MDQYCKMKNRFPFIINIILLILVNIFFNSCFSKRLTLEEQLTKYNIYSENDLKKESNIPYLLKATNDKNPYVVSTAIAALGELKYKRALPIILDKSISGKLAVRINALRAIESIGVYDAEVIRILKYLSINDRDGRVREHAIIILKNISINQINNESQMSKINPKTKIYPENKATKYPVAVSEIDVMGISEIIKTAIINRMYSELFMTNQFTVLERHKVKEILDEQGFQLTGCTSNECLVEMGKLLNVKWMIGGSITKFPKAYSMDFRIIDVESGKVVSVSIEDIQGTIEDVLSTGIKNSVYKLVSNIN